MDFVQEFRKLRLSIPTHLDKTATGGQLAESIANWTSGLIGSAWQTCAAGNGGENRCDELGDACAKFQSEGDSDNKPLPKAGSLMLR